MSYDSVVQNLVLARLYEDHMESLGYTLPPKGQKQLRGSTDMGDVSRIVPSIHPWFSIPCNNAPGHSLPFAEAAKKPESFYCAMDSASALAKAAFEVLKDRKLFEQMKAEFQAFQKLN